MNISDKAARQENEVHKKLLPFSLAACSRHRLLHFLLTIFLFSDSMLKPRSNKDKHYFIKGNH